MRKVNKNLKFLILFSIAVLLVFYPVIDSFFEQDEWKVFGRFFVLRETGILDGFYSSIKPLGTHYVPAANSLLFLLFSIFSLNYVGYAVFSIFSHLLIILIVFLLGKLIWKEKVLASLAAILFGVTASSHQSTSWAVTGVATHGAVLFGLLSSLFFLLFLSSQRRKFVWLSLVPLILSLLFKEITIGLFLILPLFYFLFGKKRRGVRKRYSLLLLGVGIAYVLFRESLFLAPEPTAVPLPTSTQSIRQIGYNAVTFPIKGISQTIIPPRQLLTLSYFIGDRLRDSITGEKETTAYDLFVQKRILEVVNFVIFGLAFLTIVYMLRKEPEGLFTKTALFGFLWAGLNSAVYVLSPERSGIITIIDSRNLYFPSIGTAIFLTSIAAKVVAAKIKRALVLLLPLVLFNIIWLNRELVSLAELGSLRREILYEIRNEYPDLPEKVVFYTDSDTAYYGLPDEEKIMPLQSGFGHTLLVWYYPQERWPKAFLKDRFLWEIREQGYKEAGGRGFGYFRDFLLLKKAINENKLEPESVFAFAWSNKTGELSDITQKIRGELRKTK